MPYIDQRIFEAYQRWGPYTQEFFDSLPDWVKEHSDLVEVWDLCIGNRSMNNSGILKAELEGVLRSRDHQKKLNGEA